MAFCTTCGQDNPGDARFCGACGSPISDSVPPVKSAPPPRQVVISGDAAKSDVGYQATMAVPSAAPAAAQDDVQAQVPTVTKGEPSGEQAIPKTAFAPAVTPVIDRITPAAGEAAPPVTSPRDIPATRRHEPVQRPAPAAAPEVETLATVAIELGRGTLRAWMLLGGVLAIAVFCAPWRVGGELVFSWDMLGQLDLLSFIRRVYLAAGGVVLVVCGLLPLSYVLRALMAFLLGVAPIALGLPDATWRQALLLAALVLLPAALLHRRRARRSIAARLLVLVGVGMLAATLLVPIPKGEPPLISAFTAAGALDALTPSQAAAQLSPLLLALLALLALLVFLPAGTSALAHVWGLLLLVYLPLAQSAPGLLRALALPATFQATPIYGAVSLLVFLICAALGAAQLLWVASGSRSAVASS